MHYPRRAKFLVFGLFVALFAMAVGLYSIVRIEQAQMANLLRDTVKGPTNGIADSAKVLRQVEAIDAPPCSDEFLGRTRQIILQSREVKDVAFQKDGTVQCSAMLGRDAKTLPRNRVPDFIAHNGWRIWLGIALLPSSDILTTVLDTGRIALEVNYRDYPTTIGGPDRQLSVIRIGAAGRTFTSSGPLLDISAAALRSAKPIETPRGLIVPACVPSHWLCFAVSMDWPGLVRTYLSWFVAMGASGALAGTLAGFAADRFCARRQSLDRALRRAMRLGELELHYQPIIDAAEGRLVSAEALLRWPGARCEHDTGKLIKAAEAGGYITDLTLFAIRRTSHDLGGLLRKDRTFTVSLNITSSDLFVPGFFEELRDFIELDDIRPHQIALEITERGVVDTVQQVEAIQRLRDRGYRIHVDDFGTGYSNLTYLSDLSVDRIKLDQSFTQHVGLGTARARLIPPILEMARELGIAVIAEGVETREQMHYFLARDVRLMQGWLFSRAISASQLEAYAKAAS